MGFISVLNSAPDGKGGIWTLASLTPNPTLFTFLLWNWRCSFYHSFYFLPSFKKRAADMGYGAPPESPDFSVTESGKRPHLVSFSKTNSCPMLQDKLSWWRNSPSQLSPHLLWTMHYFALQSKDLLRWVQMKSYSYGCAHNGLDTGERKTPGRKPKPSLSPLPLCPFLPICTVTPAQHTCRGTLPLPGRRCSTHSLPATNLLLAWSFLLFTGERLDAGPQAVHRGGKEMPVSL